MKNAKKALLLLLALTLVFTLIACGKCKHADADSDGICDECGERLESGAKSVSLIKDGVANFQFVVEDGMAGDVSKILEETVKTLSEDYDIEVAKVADKADNEIEVEVLIGDIKTRGEKYQMDKYSLGMNGYVIKIIDSKIIINAGSRDKLAEAVEEFADEILGLAEEPEELWSVTMTSEQAVEVIQSDYRITSLKVNGLDMKGYTIAVDSTNYQYRTVAVDLQTLFYTRAGYWFEIVDLDKADKSIILQKVEKSADLPNGFEIAVNGKSQIVIKCAYDNMLSEGVGKLTGSKISAATGDVEFNTGVLVGDFNASVIYYDDFGAVGDGRTNDYEAIYNAHVKANESGQTVMATAGKTYYLESPVINGTPTAIPVMTNTDWKGAKFIIDDRKISQDNDTKKWSVPLFSIEQNVEPRTFYATNAKDSVYLKAILDAGLGKNTKKIDLGDDFRCEVMIITANSSHKVYRRRGYAGGYEGATMEEAIILDKDGNVRADTPLMYDYTDLTGLEIIKLGEVEPITLKDGEFTTRASQFNCIYIRDDGLRDDYSPYIQRGLRITRSKTTVENVKHYVTDEKQFEDCVDDNRVIQFVGSTYRGFFSTIRCTDVTIKDCVLTGRRCYKRPNGGTGGTYDLYALLTNNLTFENCTQSNFWVTVDPKTYEIKAAKEGDPGAVPSMEYFPIEVYVDRNKKYESSEQITQVGQLGNAQMHWGIGGTNLCKNTNYINSTLSRYDAHEGTYGGKIVGSTICAAALTGAGDFLIQDTTTYTTGDECVFSLRSDYGYTWDGQVHLKNVKAIIHAKDDKGNYNEDISVVGPKYGNNWYWGYNPTAPSIIIEDVYFYDVDDYDPATKTYAPVSTDATIYLWGKNIPADARYHLDRVDKEPIYSVEDKDGDGYIDIPDTDADGVWGNTKWKFDEVKAFLGRDGYDDGFTPTQMQELYGELDPKHYPDANGLYENFSVVNPPEFVKIISNKGGYKYTVCNTAKDYLNEDKKISSGSFYGTEENFKGFLGSTKFYYGPGENDFVQGPPIANEAERLDDYFIFY